MATFISHSPAETEALGEAWGRAVRAGLVIGLTGDLGAGKTRLVKGLARGLGVTSRVQSPSFTLVNIYEGGRLPLFHLDLYRLDTVRQIAAAGLEEYLRPAGVTVVEWAERWFGERGQETEVRSPKSEVRSQAAPIAGCNLPVHSLPPGVVLRWVSICIMSETERRIKYEDPGP